MYHFIDADKDAANRAGNAYHSPEASKGSQRVGRGRTGIILLALAGLASGCGDGGDGAAELPGDAQAESTLPGGRCHSNADCVSGQQYCAAPGGPAACGICRHPVMTCASDVACRAAGQVCEPFTGPCTCQQESGCTAKCGTAAGDRHCGTLQACNDAGHCVDKVCATEGDCPANFTCGGGTAPHCARTTCTSDDGCPDGRCVNGTCRDDLGTCEDMVA